MTVEPLTTVIGPIFLHVPPSRMTLDALQSSLSLPQISATFEVAPAAMFTGKLTV